VEAVWAFDDPLARAGLSAPVVVGDVVFGVGTTRVYGLDVGTGDVIHEIPREEGPVSNPAVSTAGGRTLLLFVQGRNASTTLTAVDLGAAEPEVAWTYPVGARSLTGVTLAGTDGDLALLGDRRGRIHAVRLPDGEEAWTERLPGKVDAAIAATDDLVFATTYDDDEADPSVRVEALAVADGTRTWTYSPDLPMTTASAPATDGTVVVAGFGDGTVRAIDPGSGRERWVSRARGSFGTLGTISMTPAIVDGDALVADLTTAGGQLLAGALYRIDGRTGEREWDFQFDASPARGIPLVAAEVAYIGLSDGRLAAVDLATGELRWQTDAGAVAVRGLASADGRILASTGSRRGGMAAFAPSEGELSRIASPTVLDTGAMLTSLALGFLAVAVGAFVLLGLGLRWLLARSPQPGAEAAAPDGAEVDG
jgi:outer membrane protein assembly factor BamB